MARPRSFDPDQALDLARDVFWQKGFQGTSLDDITAATGLAKPSLYAAFGDKNALFLKVLERYHARIVAHAERIINDGPSARDAVHRWLTGFVPFCSGVKGKRGCLSINTSADGAAEQKEVRKRVEAFNRKLEELLRDRLRADRDTIRRRLRSRRRRAYDHGDLYRADGNGQRCAGRSARPRHARPGSETAFLTAHLHYVLLGT